MGNLEVDTTVDRVAEGRYRARLSEEWEIWGPMGGYVASLALRAAGCAASEAARDHRPAARPASFSCHYLGVAKFEEVDIRVSTLRAAKTALSQRVELSQHDRPILEATVWSIDGVEGLEHDATEPPPVPGPGELRNVTELLDDEQVKAGPPFPFWLNVENKPVRFRKDWPPPEPLPPVWQTWCRFSPVATFDDPWVDACRSLILIDVQSWPSASQPHAYLQPPFIAPSLDLYVAFHRPAPASGWLLADGSGPIAAEGLMGWNGRLWSEDHQLVASGAGQLLCRRVRP